MIAPGGTFKARQSCDQTTASTPVEEAVEAGLTRKH
jgi:hypothetical protein